MNANPAAAAGDADNATAVPDNNVPTSRTEPKRRRLCAPVSPEPADGE
ncbi:MAG: hypothetical protein ACT4PW_13995 [Acidimicrobiia bacterium]